jgi:alpha-L-fucosidase
MSDGSLPEMAVKRLKELAVWNSANGESVVGCGRSSFTPPFGCAYTQKGDILYCHFLQSPLGDVILPELKGRIKDIVPLRPEVKVRCVDEWGFELLGQFDQRIRPEGIEPGDVIKIFLTSRPEKHKMQGVDGRE